MLLLLVMATIDFSAVSPSRSKHTGSRIERGSVRLKECREQSMYRESHDQYDRLTSSVNVSVDTLTFCRKMKLDKNDFFYFPVITTLVSRL